MAFDHPLWRQENPITEPLVVLRREMIDQWVSASGGTDAHWSECIQSSQHQSKICLKRDDATRHEALQHALNDPDVSKRVAAIEALDEWEADVPVQLLIQALDDQDWDVRAAAAQALGQHCSQIPVEAVVRALQHEQDESVREALVRTLGKLGQRMPVHIIVSTLYEDDNWMVREAAAWALGGLGAQAPLKHLFRVLRCDDDESVRAAAARSLGYIGQREAMQPLLEALLDGNEEVREAASWALQQLDEETRGMTYKASQAQDEWHACGRKWQETEPDAAPVWKQVEREDALFILTDFIRDKKGHVQHQLLTTEYGQTLLFSCRYQRQMTEPSLNETLVRVLQKGSIVKPFEDVLSEHDEVLRSALSEAVSTHEEQPCDELLIVSFALSHPGEETRDAQAPLRVVFAGMGDPSMKHANRSVLDQIVTTWSETVKEPLACQHPHNLIDLAIWCQPEIQLSLAP